MMDFDGVNWAGWTLLVIYTASTVLVPFFIGKPRPPYNGVTFVSYLIVTALLLFALGIL